MPYSSSKVALYAGACALLMACSSNRAGAPEPGAEEPSAAAVADAVSAATASCEQMTCPTSTPGRVEGCTRFETLRAASLTERTVLSASGTTRGASDTSHSEFGGCAGATSGPDVWYQLDLSNAPQPLQIHVVVDAGFDAAVDLRRGPCGDTRSISCDRAAVVGRVSSTLSERLDPGVYWLVVDGASSSSAGDFRLEIEATPLLGCTSPLPNLSCERAVPLEALERQAVLLDEACVAEAGSDAELYYQLDLSAEAGPLVANLTLWSLNPQPISEHVRVYSLDADPADCATPLADSYFGSGGAGRSSAAVQLLLPPGRYAIGAQLGALEEDNPTALTVELDRSTCAGGPAGNDCVDALDDIDPTAASQLVAGSTACNTNRRTQLPCGYEDEPAPEQYHRLDLRGAAGVTRTRLTVLVDGLSFLPLLSVFSSSATGECGDALYCDARVSNFEGPPHVDLLLEPALYFVSIDGSERDAAGSYQMLVELEPGEPSPCVTHQIDECMFGYQTSACCSDWSPLCNQMVAVCGLSPATQACVCATNPACCTSNLLAPDCRAVQLACNYLCPDFAPQETSCLGAEQ